MKNGTYRNDFSFHMAGDKAPIKFLCFVLFLFFFLSYNSYVELFFKFKLTQMIIFNDRSHFRMIYYSAGKMYVGMHRYKKITNPSCR